MCDDILIKSCVSGDPIFLIFQKDRQSSLDMAIAISLVAFDKVIFP